MPGIAGVLRYAALSEGYNGIIVMPDNSCYNGGLNVIKVRRLKSRDWPQHRHGSPKCSGSRGEERTVGVTDRLCVEA